MLMVFAAGVALPVAGIAADVKSAGATIHEQTCMKLAMKISKESVEVLSSSEYRYWKNDCRSMISQDDQGRPAGMKVATKAAGSNAR